MLVLKRNVYGNNALVIQTSDGEIEISILHVRGGQVKVGIAAPDEVDIWRSEIFGKETAA